MQLNRRQNNEAIDRRVPFLKKGGIRFALLALMAAVALVVQWMLLPRSLGVSDSAEISNDRSVDSLPDAESATLIPAEIAAPIEVQWDWVRMPVPAGRGWAQELDALKHLARENPNAALEQLNEISVAEEQQVAVREVCAIIATNDPALSLKSAWHFELGKLGGRAEADALQALAYRWADAEPEAALNWARLQTRDEGGRLDCVLKGIARARSEESPAEAARLIAEFMSPNFSQFDAAMHLVGDWAKADFAAASAWVDLFPHGPVQDRGREELSKAFASDPASSLETP